jgi:predicted dienelactone hydrolase
VSSIKGKLPRFRVVMALVACATGVLGAQTTSPPTPTGPYSVGRMRCDWVDESRADTIEQSGGKREIVVWVWYPATPKRGAVRAEWLPGKWGALYASELQRLQPDDVKPLQQGVAPPLLVHAYQDAPVTAGRQRFPVLVFSPGFGVLPTTYTALIEDIVSHGYIVAGIVPTYFVPVTMFDDGRVVSGRSLGPMISLSTLVGDIVFTLNQLAKMDADTTSALHGRLDLERIGLFGHSRGGATSFQAAKEDQRVKAAVDLDGTLIGSVAQQGLAKPLALILSGDFLTQQRELEAAPKDDPRRRVLDAYDLVFRSGSPGYRVILPSTTHMSFSDVGWLPFMSDSYKATLGAIDRTRALRVSADYIEAFFDQHLKGKPSPLMTAPSTHYPEARFEMSRQ